MTHIIDADQHFWTYNTYQTSWMECPPYANDSTFAAIRRSFGPEDLLPHLLDAGVRATITVQAANGDLENAALLTHAQQVNWIAGVVGWFPLTRPDRTARQLETLTKQSKLVGVRHLINVEPDPDWIRSPNVVESLRCIAAHGLAFDYVGILPRHLEHVPWLAEQVPTLRIIIDHLGKPPTEASAFERWAKLLARAADAPNVFAKISGLDVGRGPCWSSIDVQAAVDHALINFSAHRLMFGSDWPVANLRGGYAKVWDEAKASLAAISIADKDRIFGGTAAEVYRLGDVIAGPHP